MSIAATLATLACLSAAPATAATTSAPLWNLSIVSSPTNFAPGDSTGYDAYYIEVTNSGGAATTGTFTITDTLPAGITPDPSGPNTGLGDGTGGTKMSCTTAGQTITCSSPDMLTAGMSEVVAIPVDVASDAPSNVTDTVSVSGGGASTVSTSSETSITATPPEFGLLAGTAGFSTSLTNADGSPDTQAGSHPYEFTTTLNLNTQLPTDAPSEVLPVGHIDDLTTNLPAGLIVNANAVPRCTEAELESDISNTPTSGCPADTAVGLVDLGLDVFGGQPVYFTAALYNMVPPPGVPAEFGFDPGGLGNYQHLAGSVRTASDYGLTSTSNETLAQYAITQATVTLWGDPYDPSHDGVRGRCGIDASAPASADAIGSCPLSATPASTPFLTLPSACSGPLTTTLSMNSWEDQSSFVNDSAETAAQNSSPVGVTGCDQLDFTPSLSVQPTSQAADSASGVNFNLGVPDLESESGLAESTVKKVVVTLPPGATLNPSAAVGLQGCTPAEIGLDNAAEPSCPDASKVASVTLNTPLLPDAMTGGVYLAKPFDNPFDTLVAGYLVAQADGALIKLPGEFQLNQQTGQITSVFDNNPQLPFSNLNIDFFGGQHGDLATPTACGTYQTTSELTPWSSVTPTNAAGTATASPSDSFTISSNCSPGFSPSFTAGSENPQAGAYSPFVLSFSRTDDDQFFSGLSVTLPPGMLAKLAGVQECTDAELATISTQPGTGIEQQEHPSCPAGSQVGAVETSAGAGDPISIPGKAYLTGPYKGAPYGLAIVVPAIAGPFDLGSVVVRQALDVNPTTAQVTDVSDPFPTILDGIPLRMREVDVVLNRPDFTVNPTSCDVMNVGGAFTSTLSITADESSRFQVGGCASLPFKPKLRMALTGKGQTKSGDHPTLTSTLTQPTGQANINNVRVALPLNFALDPNNSQNVCSYQIAQAVTTGPANCPASTIVGHATAVTPLLSQPLSGPAYLVQGLSFKGGVETHTLPTLLIPLRGQIALDLRAQTSVSHNKLVTTFPTIPDAAVSKFTLTINGGKKGILVITGRGRSICGKPQITQANLIAQSAKAEYPNVKMSTPCRAAKRPKHRKRHR